MKYLWIIPVLLIAGCSSPTDAPVARSIGWVGASTELGAGGERLITIYADIYGGENDDVFTTAISIPLPGGDYEESYGYSVGYVPHGGLRASQLFTLDASVGSSGDPFYYHVEWGDVVSDTYQGTLP